MSAFGRRPGTAGRPAFGVAKPMQTGPGVPGGAQFPAIDAAAPEPSPAALSPEQEAMERLNQRSTAEMAEPEKAQGFEARSEEHTSELQSLMPLSYAVFCM